MPPDVDDATIAESFPSWPTPASGASTRPGKIAGEEYDRITSIDLTGTAFTVPSVLPLLPAGASVILFFFSSTLARRPRPRRPCRHF